MPSTTAAVVAEALQAYDLVMHSAVSPLNDVQYGRFQRYDQASAVGKLLLAADTLDAPEWDRFDVIPVAAIPILAWTDGASIWLSPIGNGLGPCTIALVDADAVLASAAASRER